MADATGEGKESPLRVAFDRRIKLEFHGARITSDGGLLAYRELDDVFDLTAMGASALGEGRPGRNIRHHLPGLLRQAVYGRLAGYEDVNDAERLARDPVIAPSSAARVWTDRRPRPARWAASRPSGWQARRTSRRSRTCPAPGSTGCMCDDGQAASSSTWTVPRARPMASRRARPTTVTSAAPVTTRSSSSTSSATWSAASCGLAMLIAPKVG